MSRMPPGASLTSTPPGRLRAASFSLMRSRASDMRSTAEYRRRVACNLLRAFWIETT